MVETKQMDETITEFHTRLQQLAVNCEFADKDAEIKSHIIRGCKSSSLRRKALREDSSLSAILDSAKAAELAESQAALMRDHRIIIPKSLRQQVVDIAHEGHQGVVKTKQLLREKVWFTGIDKMVEKTVSSCLPCQASTVERQPSEPLQMSDLPQGAWQEVSVDFKELPTGEYLLVVVDDYSRFPVVDIVHSTAATTVIPKLDTIFSTHGVPVVVRSDNGPPFNSNDFAEFAKYLGFKHRKVTPLWPQANGEVERMMRNLKKLYHTAKAESKNWKQELNKYLKNYRATPHSTTGKSPASMLYGRQFRIRLPEISQPAANDKTARTKDKEQKTKMKTNADKKRGSRSKNIQVGDSVLIKESGKISGSQTPYKIQPYRVTAKNGSMITARRGRHTVTRNISYFKLLKSETPIPVPTDDDDGDMMSDAESSVEQPQQPAPTPPPPVRRYPRRNRQRPQRLQDFVVDV